MGGQWAAIAITVVAATGNNVGKALQKEATRKLPRFSLDPAIVIQYVRSRQWLAGLAADLAGGLLMIAAFALAPVSLVQPVSGVGLVSLALFSHFYLRESLQPGEWLAVALAGAGTVGLGATTEEAPSGAAVSVMRAVVVVSLLVLLVGVLSMLRLARRQRRAKRGAPAVPRSGAYIFGLQAGACFGLSASCCRMGFLLASRQPLCVPAGLAASVGLTSSGFALQTCGLKDGNSLVVCTAAAVASMVSGVAVGLLALGEKLPASPAARLARLASWTCIMAGVAGLASGSGSMQQMVGLAATKLPAWAWGMLPQRAALLLRTAARSYTESRLLPVFAVGGIAGSPLLLRPGHRSGRGVGSQESPGLGGVATLRGAGGSADSLESPKAWAYASSPRRPAVQLQAQVSGGLSRLGNMPPEPGSSYVANSPLTANTVAQSPAAAHSE